MVCRNGELSTQRFRNQHWKGTLEIRSSMLSFYKCKDGVRELVPIEHLSCTRLYMYLDRALCIYDPK